VVSRQKDDLANLKTLAKSSSLTWGNDTPLWATNPTTIQRVTTTHKANLYRKDPEYYYDFADAVNSEFNKPRRYQCMPILLAYTPIKEINERYL
jgi:hypothetical protein